MGHSTPFIYSRYNNYYLRERISMPWRKGKWLNETNNIRYQENWVWFCEFDILASCLGFSSLWVMWRLRLITKMCHCTQILTCHARSRQWFGDTKSYMYMPTVGMGIWQRSWFLLNLHVEPTLCMLACLCIEDQVQVGVTIHHRGNQRNLKRGWSDCWDLW